MGSGYWIYIQFQHLGPPFPGGPGGVPRPPLPGGPARGGPGGSGGSGGVPGGSQGGLQGGPERRKRAQNPGFRAKIRKIVRDKGSPGPPRGAGFSGGVLGGLGPPAGGLHMKTLKNGVFGTPPRTPPGAEISGFSGGRGFPGFPGSGDPPGDPLGCAIAEPPDDPGVPPGGYPRTTNPPAHRWGVLGGLGPLPRP